MAFEDGGGSVGDAFARLDRDGSERLDAPSPRPQNSFRVFASFRASGLRKSLFGSVDESSRELKRNERWLFFHLRHRIVTESERERERERDLKGRTALRCPLGKSDSRYIYISQACELYAGLKSLGAAFETLTKLDASRLVERLDSDGDGLLDATELAAFAREASCSVFEFRSSLRTAETVKGLWTIWSVCGAEGRWRDARAQSALELSVVQIG